MSYSWFQQKSTGVWSHPNYLLDKVYSFFPKHCRRISRDCFFAWVSIQRAFHVFLWDYTHGDSLYSLHFTAFLWLKSINTSIRLSWRFLDLFWPTSRLVSHVLCSVTRFLQAKFTAYLSLQWAFCCPSLSSGFHLHWIIWNNGQS